MAETKYGKHVIKEPFVTIPHYTGPSILSHEGEFDADVCVGYHCLANAEYKAERPHTHDYHELLCFIGGDPTNLGEFGAEIEICLGEEQEKHVITSTTVVSIPPGLVHCPLRVNKLDKPVVFLEISLTRKFEGKFLEK
jgi:hypothetical protein